MRDAFYEVYDEFIELYDDYFLAAREIGKKFPKYRGTVYVFLRTGKNLQSMS